MTHHNYAPRLHHVQPGVSAYEKSANEALEYLQGAVRQMALSPHLCRTKTIAKELQKTADFLAIIKLENDLYKRASKEWCNNFDQRELVTQKQALLRLKEKFADPGGQFLPRYRVNMNMGPLLCSSEDCRKKEMNKKNDETDGIGWTDTSYKAAHAWAQHELMGLNSELAPLAYAAKRRLEQYTDDLEITNRYSAYRRNMGYLAKSKAGEKGAVENIVDLNIRPEIAPRWNLGREWLRSKNVNTENYLAPGDSLDCGVNQDEFMQRYNIKVDPIKEAGLWADFPGKSEYQDNFSAPSMVGTSEESAHFRGRGSHIELDADRVQNKGYLVNPTPNYMRDYRPPRQLEPDILISETQDRFQSPEISLQRKIKNVY
ncbi:unnamed protein product [Trichobilharzia szidati]|nr:unnamed protein product [Trichobilharzia szidati]